MNEQDALGLIITIQAARFESASVEVKTAHGQLPRRIHETLSAFANQPGGGVLILGISEEQGFEPVGVLEPQAMLAQLADTARTMVPVLCLDTVVVEVESKHVIVVEVPECSYTHKPCFYKPSGMNAGSFIRVESTNRRMTDYEVFSYVNGRSQPRFDYEPVTQARVDDLNQEHLARYIESIRRTRPRLWTRLSMDEMSLTERLCQLDVATHTDADLCPTLAGLLCFGVWPQKYFPSLVVTFVHYPGIGPEEKGPRGERFLDSLKCEGSMVQIVEQVVSRVTSNMRQSLLVEGMFHRTMSEYPDEAIREAVVNAVVHRDYSPVARSSQIRIQMFPDRLEVQSPGGLHGPVSEENLEEAQSTRNQLLMRFLEEQGLVENRGSGIRAMMAAMREARLEPPRFRDSRSYFRVTFKNASLMNPNAVNWLNRFAGYQISDDQRMALVYLRHNERMTNSDYRRLNNVYDTIRATRDLRELTDQGLIRMHGTRRWAYYTLTSDSETPVAAVRGDIEESKILEYVRQHGSITRRDCQVLLGGQPSHASYRLRRMVKEGNLQKHGRRRWTHYTLPRS